MLGKRWQTKLVSSRWNVISPACSGIVLLRSLRRINIIYWHKHEAKWMLMSLYICLMCKWVSMYQQVHINLKKWHNFSGVFTACFCFKVAKKSLFKIGLTVDRKPQYHVEIFARDQRKKTLYGKINWLGKVEQLLAWKGLQVCFPFKNQAVVWKLRLQLYFILQQSLTLTNLFLSKKK